MTASHVLAHIRRLDPRKDHQQIFYLSLYHDFPVDASLVALLLLLRSFSVPRISALLDATGQFYSPGRHRSTALVGALAELVRFGYDSDRGRVVIARMNKAHGRHDTANEDFLYLLSRFVLEPVDWTDRFGWRPLCEQERLALFFFWREVGCRMNIDNIPPTLAELTRFSRDFERDCCRPAEANYRLFVNLRDVLAGWFPAVLRPLVRRSFPYLMDEALRRNLMVPEPPRLLQAKVTAALRLRAWALKRIPARRQPYLPVVRLSDWTTLAPQPISHPG